MKVVEALLKGCYKSGFDVHRAVFDGSDPLQVAAEMGHTEVVGVLLQDRLEQEQRKMLATALGLHWRLGTESVLFRLDNNLLKMNCCAAGVGRGG